jgi:hypothetical protein
MCAIERGGYIQYMCSIEGVIHTTIYIHINRYIYTYRYIYKYGSVNTHTA